MSHDLCIIPYDLHMMSCGIRGGSHDLHMISRDTGGVSHDSGVTHSTSVCLCLQFLGFSTSRSPFRISGRQERRSEMGRTCKRLENEKALKCQPSAQEEHTL